MPRAPRPTRATTTRPAADKPGRMPARATVSRRRATGADQLTAAKRANGTSRPASATTTAAPTTKKAASTASTRPAAVPAKKNGAARRQSARTVRLSQDSILAAYLRLVARDGTDFVSLRRLGAEMGVDSTAIYRHFRSKDELLAVAADRVLASAFEGLDLTGTWREQLTVMATALRRAYLTHPHALLALRNNPVELPMAFTLVERAMSALAASGLPAEEIPSIYQALETFTAAVTLHDTGATQDGLDRWRRLYSSLPGAYFPTLTGVSDHLYLDVDTAFDVGLELLLDAIEMRAETAHRRAEDDRPAASKRSRPATGQGSGSRRARAATL